LFDGSPSSDCAGVAVALEGLFLDISSKTLEIKFLLENFSNGLLRGGEGGEYWTTDSCQKNCVKFRILCQREPL
jgi:hypothetical protein